MRFVHRPLLLAVCAVWLACHDDGVAEIDVSGVNYASAGSSQYDVTVPATSPEDATPGEPRETDTADEPRDEDGSVTPDIPTEPSVADADEFPEEGPGPTRYPSDRVHSPLTPHVVENLRTIAAMDDALQDDVFAKVGASSLDSPQMLTCFAGEHVDRELMSPPSEDTLDLFLGGDAGGEDPFSRDALSAVSGKTAAWAIAGDPSPLDEELAITRARFGLVEYGTNDMGMGTTYASAMPGFADALVSLVDSLIMAGVIPVLHTNRARLDSASAALWVGTYNAVIRGVAQGRQIPLLDQHLLFEDLPDYGLGSDGLHMSAYTEAGAQRTCRFSDEALSYGYNARNLATIDALARLTAVVTDGLDAPDQGAGPLGDGSLGSPYVIDQLPFTAMRNTEDSLQAALDVYSGCAADQDESGPEHLYQLVLSEPARLRAMVLDQGEVDIDLHVLNDTATEAGCMARHDRLWEGTLGAGTYYFSLDTYVSAGVPKPGEYLFVLARCHPDDDACD
ncbi:MAG: SGNH/GDSL hydrolase family protein [Myxococcota bacterium]